jgi:hypothetical protein
MRNVDLYSDLITRLAGANKFGLMTCPICKSPGDLSSVAVRAAFFIFTDKLSHTEYGISGLCQCCQDQVFKEPED